MFRPEIRLLMGFQAAEDSNHSQASSFVSGFPLQSFGWSKTPRSTANTPRSLTNLPRFV
jgi:hypothetical protein